MSIYSIPPLIISVLTLLVGLFVLFRGKRSAFTLVAVSVFIWLFGYALMYSTKDYELALILARGLYTGVVFIPVFSYHFIIVFLNLKSKKPLISFYYFFTLIFVYMIWKTDFINGLYEYYWGYQTKVGFGHNIFLAFFLAVLLRIFFLLYSAYRKTERNGSPIEHIRIKYVMMSYMVSILAVFDFLPNYGIQFYPLGFIFIGFYAVLTTYAILRHRLMDIEVIIRETALFAGIFGFSVGLFMLAIVAGEQFLQPYIGQSQWLVPAVALLLVTFAIRPIEKLAYNVIGRHLFRKKFEYRKILRDASAGMSTIRNPKKLLCLIVHIISMKIRLSNASILIYDEKQALYKIKASRNRGKLEDINMALSKENPLIEWLSEKKKPLTLEEIQRWSRDNLNYSAKSVLASDLAQIEHRMKDLGAAICVPSFYRDELLGILVLGEKRSGDFFSQDDLDLFTALADESAIAFKNSQLYFEIDKKADELEALYKREHRLFMHASMAFAAAIDARDPYTHGHSERVTNFSLAILNCMGAVPEIDKNPLFRQRLQITAVLHDIGKIGVPDGVLHKPSKLSAKEWEAMKKHPLTGAEIVTHIRGLRDLIGGIKYHHERYDGKGYPEGLKSDEIPFMAKIIAVADTFDAMTSDRPYRKSMPVEAAKEEIQRNAATQFDPYIVAAFLKAFEKGDIKQSVLL
jgi:HD-GYP domain-containing protein (c-di-GMP phosphodiesterase class II)